MRKREKEKRGKEGKGEKKIKGEKGKKGKREKGKKRKREKENKGKREKEDTRTRWSFQFHLADLSRIAFCLSGMCMAGNFIKLPL